MLYLLFRLGSQRYALNSSQIVELLPLVEWQTMPGVPSAVLGVFSYHGALVPVLDLGLLTLGTPARKQMDTRIALVDYPTPAGESHLLGLLVEHVSGLLRRGEAEFTPSPVQSNLPYAGSVTHDEQGLIQRIELAQLVPDDLWERLQVGAGAGGP